VVLAELQLNGEGLQFDFTAAANKAQKSLVVRRAFWRAQQFDRRKLCIRILRIVGRQPDMSPIGDR